MTKRTRSAAHPCARVSLRTRFHPLSQAAVSRPRAPMMPPSSRAVAAGAAPARAQRCVHAWLYRPFAHRACAYAPSVSAHGPPISRSAQRARRWPRRRERLARGGRATCAVIHYSFVLGPHASPSSATECTLAPPPYVSSTTTWTNPPSAGASGEAANVCCSLVF